jgi:transcriptional regulator with XRE-family HTH domain
MNKLKDLRLANKLTQEQVSSDTGLSRAMIYYLETGKRPMRLQHAKVLAPYFGVSVDYIMGTDAIYFAGSLEDALNNLLADMFDEITAASVEHKLSKRTRLLYVVIERLLESGLSDSDLEAVLLYVDGLVAVKGDK